MTELAQPSPLPSTLAPSPLAPSPLAPSPLAQSTLAKFFEPAAIEARWSAHWEQTGVYAPTLDAAKPSFSIQLPPPNVTGTLH